MHLNKIYNLKFTIMKKMNIKPMLILSLVLLLGINQNIAQNVGIGSTSFTPDASAGLEIQFNNKGLLVPQIALTGENDASTILSPATSLLVYNTTVGSGLVAGYYYNAGTPAAPSWKRLTTTNDIVVADGSETIVTAGTNVTITGTGTTGNPYVVNASGGGSAARYLGEEYLGGIIYYLYLDANGVQRGLIVSKTQTNTQWQSTNSLTNANRSWDGAFNTNLMTNSPARTWINNNFNTGGLNAGAGVWYLPSIDELRLIFDNRSFINKWLNNAGGTLLTTAVYWSSTEDGVNDAWIFNFFSGGANFSLVSKSNDRSVRAIRAF